MNDHDTALVGDHYEMPAFVAHSNGVTVPILVGCNPGGVWFRIVEFNGCKYSAEELFSHGWRVVPCKIHVDALEDGQAYSPEKIQAECEQRRLKRGERSLWSIENVLGD